MADELAIQQVQQNQGSVTPYVIGGAAVGGVGGYLSPVGVKKPKYTSFDDILKESEDTFKTQIEKDTENKTFWETAQKHVEAVKNAEKEYDDKVAKIKEESKTATGQLPADNEAAKKLTEAQKAYDDELAKLVEAEKKKLGKGTVEIKAGEIKKFSELTTDQLPTTYASGKQKGKKIAGNDIEKLYERLTNEVKNAENALETRLNTTLRADKNAALADFQVNIIGKAITDTEALPADDFAEYFEKGTRKHPSESYKRAVKIANTYYADVTTLTQDQLASIGTEYKPGESIPKRMRTASFSVKDPTTNRYVTRNIYYDPDVYDNLLDAEQKKVENLRKNLADQLFAESQRASTLNRELRVLDKKFEQSLRNDMNQLTNTGLYDPVTDKLDLAKIKSEGGFIAGKKDSKYIADMKILEDAYRDAIKTAKKTGGSPILSPLPTGLSGNYGSATIEEALKQAQARHSILKKYSSEYNTLYTQIQNCAKNNTIVQELDTKIAEAISNDKGVQKARAALAEQFPEVYSAKASKLSADEIAAKAQEAAQKAVDSSSVKSKLEAAKKAAEEEAKKLGLSAKELTDDELAKILKEKGLGSKEEYLAQLKKAAQEAVEKDLGKIKGPNKWVNAAIAAAALVLVGWGIGKAANKN